MMKERVETCPSRALRVCEAEAEEDEDEDEDEGKGQNEKDRMCIRYFRTKVQPPTREKKDPTK